MDLANAVQRNHSQQTLWGWDQDDWPTMILLLYVPDNHLREVQYPSVSHLLLLTLPICRPYHYD
jgi:hypothetical protein